MKDNRNQNLITSKEATFIYGLSLVAMLVLSLIAGALPEGNAQVLASYACAQIAFLIVPLIYLKTKKIPLSLALPAENKLKVIPLILLAPITIGAFMQNTLLAVAFNWLMEAIGLTPSVSIPSLDGAGNIILAILVVAVMPAIGEEIMYRGVMLSAHTDKGLFNACLLSGIIFSLSHFNPAQLVHQFILGVILAFLVASTGNIWYAIITHFINNLLALFVGEIIPQYNTLATLHTTTVLILIALCIVGAVVLIPSLIAFMKFGAKEALKVKRNNLFLLPLKDKAPSWHFNLQKVKGVDYYLVGLISFMVILSILTALTPLMTA